MEEHCKEVDREDTELVDVMVDLIHSVEVDRNKYRVHSIDYQALLVDQIN